MLISYIILHFDFIKIKARKNEGRLIKEYESKTNAFESFI